ncbi:CBS domain-containing protein [Campylobacter volucris]|uniref:CBS domain-containing protein n=1 Tax=Campylobacter volucris TaxID=1031542 RepID=UPI0010597161|nr:CBS domain-containing protein [Campylobacter volucris]TDJ82099.1 CBS domain-containing protein [Campylobacter volucris]
MRVSASIYSNTIKNISSLVTELGKYNIDFIHIDCNDDHAVFKDIKLIREITNIPIDLHIISKYPSRFYNDIIDNEIEFVTFQYECIKEKLILPPEIIAKTKIGIAIMTDTSIDVFDKFKDFADFVLIMATIPGKSGGKFAVENFQKIRDFHKKYNTKKIHVDGGINAEIAFILRNLGVYSVVSGSYLVNSNDIFKSLFDLKYGVNMKYKVADFMVPYDDLPILNLSNITLASLIDITLTVNLGFCIITKENNLLYGIVTVGDILRYINKNSTNLQNIINKTPIYININCSVSDMINLIEDTDKYLLFIPVVDNNNKVVGAVSFKELIKGGF